MTVVKARRDPPVDLDGHVGLHVPTIAHPQAERLHWTRVHRPERSRPMVWTCERCQSVSYLLANRGGMYLIRRTERTRSAPVIHETPRCRTAWPSSGGRRSSTGWRTETAAPGMAIPGRGGHWRMWTPRPRAGGLSVEEDDSIIGMTFNLIIGAVVLTFEIGVWPIAAVCMAIVAIFEIFFEDGPE